MSAADELEVIRGELRAARAQLSACERERLKSHREANEWCEKTLSALRERDEARAALLARDSDARLAIALAEELTEDLDRERVAHKASCEFANEMGKMRLEQTRAAEQDAARLAAALCTHRIHGFTCERWGDEDEAALAAHEARVKGGAPR